MSERRPNALVQLSLARWRSFYRDPGVLFWTIGFPLLLAMCLGMAFRTSSVARVPVAVTPCAQEGAIVAALDTAGMAPVRMSLDEAARAIRSGKIALAVARDTGALRLTFDPTRPESRLARALAKDAVEQSSGRRDLVAVEDHAVSEPGARYIDFLIPGLIGLNLMNGGLWGVGFMVVDLRSKKLLRRFAATPMRRTDFLLSFGLLRSMLLVIELPVLVIFARLVFDVPLRGSLVTFVLVSVLGALAFAGLGLLIASRAPNSQTVNGIINLVSLPMTLGSGVFFATDRFPHVARVILGYLPLTALNDMLRAIMLDGASLGAITTPLAYLTGGGLVCFVLALVLFRWR